MMEADLTVLTFPDEVGFASATGLLVGLLCRTSIATSITQYYVSEPTKRLIDTQFGCTSRHDVHCTLKV